MKFYLKLLAIICAVCCYLMPAAYAQSAPPLGATPEPKDEKSVAARKGFKTKVFEVRFRDPKSLENMLEGLSSHENGSLVQTNSELKTIVVRDYPEIVASIEDVLKRLDVPRQLPSNFEVQLHLIAASRVSTEKGDFPPGLIAVMTQLQSTLKYSGYRYITTLLNRIGEDGNLTATGSTDQIFPLAQSKGKAFYQYGFKNIRPVNDAGGKEIIQISNFRFEVRTPIAVEAGPGATRLDYQTFMIDTDLGLREGEMVVVGTANIGSSDEAIIIVITVKKAG